MKHYHDFPNICNVLVANAGCESLIGFSHFVEGNSKAETRPKNPTTHTQEAAVNAQTIFELYTLELPASRLQAIDTALGRHRYFRSAGWAFPCQGEDPAFDRVLQEDLDVRAFYNAIAHGEGTPAYGQPPETA